jgi:hypothetical protein
MVHDANAAPGVIHESTEEENEWLQVTGALVSVLSKCPEWIHNHVAEMQVLCRVA